jgi:hypothetical protein
MTEKTEDLDEAVQAVGARCAGVQSRVDKLRDELIVLVGVEAHKRADSIATTHAMLDSGMQHHQAEQKQLSSALQVRPHTRWALPHSSTFISVACMDAKCAVGPSQQHLQVAESDI